VEELRFFAAEEVPDNISAPIRRGVEKWLSLHR